MKKAFSLQIFLFLIFLVIQKSLDAQIRPRVIECPVNSISPTVLDAGSGSGQVYPTVTVSTLNNCTTYTISCSYSWISYSRNGLYITVSVQANTGPARTGYVNIGDKTLTVNQACGNNPVEPKRLYVDRNNICADAGGVINLSVIGGSGSATRWFTGACGGTQIGYTDGTSIEIDAPTETTTYYARWETTCGNSNCKQITVTVYPSPIPTISGPSSACLNSSGNVYTTEADMTGYSWTVTGGTITSGGGSTDNSVTVIWTTQGIGHVKVNYTNSNGCTAENQTDNPVTILPETEILSQPANINIQQYQEAVFTVLATGTNLQYQWQASSAPEGTWTNLNSLPASGYNTDTLTMYWQSTTQYTLFRCQIISDCDTVFSNIGILTIDLPETNYLTGNNILDPETKTLNQSYPVGTTNGFLNVNSFGSATYEVPIYIAPGTTGMQPSLSIAYNSHGKIGLLGQRWDLNGLSEIHRVPKDIYHDNEVNGINLQNTDMFALDSNRLVLTSQHAYGADGSEYTTEYETFARISAHDTAGTGPSWFKVETKDGRTIEYGNSTGSKVEALGSNTVYRWRINKVYDQYGNTIKYSYNEANGESFISQIDYTANDSANLTTPYNSIKFDYALRTDKNSKYVGGSKIPQTVLLTEIKAQADNDSIVRKYEFKYFLDSLNISYLNEIVEYGEDDAHLNSTVIGWVLQLPILCLKMSLTTLLLTIITLEILMVTV